MIAKNYFLALIAVMMLAVLAVPCFAFEVSEESTTNVVCPGTTIVLPFTVKATTAASFTVAISGTASSFATVLPSGFWLNPGESKTFFVYVTPSSRIAPGSYLLKITIGGEETKEITKEIVVENCHKLEIKAEDTARACSCEETTLSFTLTNKGKYLETYKLSVEGPAAKWTTLSSNTITLNPDESTKVTAYVKAPCKVKGDYELNLVAEAYPYLKLNKKVALEVLNCYDYKLTVEKTFYSICEAQELKVPVAIKNNGVASNSYKINLDAPSWMKSDQTEITIGKDEEKIVNLIVKPPFGTEGTFKATLEFLSNFGKVLKKQEIEVSVERCYGVTATIETEKDELCNGLTKSYAINVRNTGKFANTFDLAVEGADFATLSNTTVTLNTSEQKTINLIVSPKPNTPAISHNIVVRIYDKVSGVEANVTLNLKTISLEDCYKPAVSSEKDSMEVSQDMSSTLPIKVENRGTNEANYSLEVTGTASSFAQLNPAAITVEPGKTQTVYLYVAPSLEVALGEYEAIVTARLPETKVEASKKIKIVVEKAKEVKAPVTPAPVVNETNATNETITGKAVEEIEEKEERERKKSLLVRFFEWFLGLFKGRGEKKEAESISNLTGISITTGTVNESVENENESKENRPPILKKEIPDIVIEKNKNYSITLSDYFGDPDKDVLRYTIIKPTNIDVKIENEVLTLTPEKDFTGNRTLTLYAYDGKSVTASNEIKIKVVESTE